MVYAAREAARVGGRVARHFADGDLLVWGNGKRRMGAGMGWGTDDGHGGVCIGRLEGADECHGLGRRG